MRLTRQRLGLRTCGALVGLAGFSVLLSGCDRVVFARPAAFVLLIPVVALCVIMAVRSPATFRYSRGKTLERLPTTWRIRLRRLPEILYVLALILVVIALGRPQDHAFRDANVQGIDIMLAFDMSGSMAAVDEPLTEIRAYQRRYRENPPNRFDHAKETLKRFVKGRKHDRIGMVVFAKDAYLQFPLTLDYATIETLLDQLQLTSIDPSATAIGNAMGLSIRALMESDATSKTIILITDGKQQGGNISPLHTANIAADEGIRVFPILVGSGGESLVPVGGITQKLSRFRPENHPVDPDLLKKIADITHGSFYRATRPEKLQQDLNKILDELDRSRIHDVSSVRANELYMPFGLAAVVLILLAACLDSFWLRRFP